MLGFRCEHVRKTLNTELLNCENLAEIKNFQHFELVESVGHPKPLYSIETW